MENGKEVIDVERVVKAIYALQEESAQIKEQVADFKDLLIEAGFSKRQISEGFRMLKQDDDERNLILTGSNKILTALGHKEINPYFFDLGTAE
jgi:uncharacterized protein (UPF0335 family)